MLPIFVVPRVSDYQKQHQIKFVLNFIIEHYMSSFSNDSFADTIVADTYKVGGFRKNVVIPYKSVKKMMKVGIISISFCLNRCRIIMKRNNFGISVKPTFHTIIREKDLIDLKNYFTDLQTKLTDLNVDIVSRDF